MPGPPDHLPSWRVLLIISVVLTVAAGAAFAVRVGADDGDDDQAPGTARLQYVALGDSYTSAPYVPPQSADDPCLRSGANYPHLLAQELSALDLTDVSCGGATTANMLELQVLGESQLPAQFEALDQSTDLVTVGIGANDLSLFSSLIYACFPGVREGETCHTASPRGAALQPILDRVESNVRQVLEAISDRAPDARVIVVPYPQMLTAAARCAGRLPFGAADSAYIADVNRRLSLALIDAATEANVEYADVLAASAGHDIRSTDPWVMGSRTDPDLAASFHPLPEGQQAVAGLLREQLCDDDMAC